MKQPRSRHTRCTEMVRASPRLAKDVNTDEENELERLEGWIVYDSGERSACALEGPKRDR